MIKKELPLLLILISPLYGMEVSKTGSVDYSIIVTALSSECESYLKKLEADKRDIEDKLNDQIRSNSESELLKSKLKKNEAYREVITQKKTLLELYYKLDYAKECSKNPQMMCLELSKEEYHLFFFMVKRQVLQEYKALTIPQTSEPVIVRPAPVSSTCHKGPFSFFEEKFLKKEPRERSHTHS